MRDEESKVLLKEHLKIFNVNIFQSVFEALKIKDLFFV